ncbi:hypothetical protein B0T25DRAFT_603399 [Lasiosphaeria hispida]|uniref:Uncharacterized protein n=1 Tax=Lasiosphaeria hispida TaxID=260671 RepID=A0AAJ0HLJ0_9PEZI|nr:hypothetical protein B0T25DRAFT_603399 [Lasiosphaeria hispida]
MSGIYYVHLKWAPKDGNHTAAWGRYHLCFPSRYIADEFYRAIQQVKNGNDLVFPELVRSSPQFWCHSALTWDVPHTVQALGLVDEFRQVVSTSIINDGLGGGRSFSLILNPVTGPDWLSGGTFFIRNRRQPNLYWFLHREHVHVSDEGRTKFRVDMAKPTRQQQDLKQLVLIREDEVYVSIVTETTTSFVVRDDKKRYLGLAPNSSAGSPRKVTPVIDAHPWTFGNLLCNSVGVIWEPEEGDGEEMRPHLAHMTEGGADEWELC